MATNLNILILFDKTYDIYSLRKKILKSKYITKIGMEFHCEVFNDKDLDINEQYSIDLELKYSKSKIKMSLDFFSKNTSIAFISNYFSSDSVFFSENESIYMNLRNTIPNCDFIAHDNFHDIQFVEILNTLRSGKSLDEILGLSIY